MHCHFAGFFPVQFTPIRVIMPGLQPEKIVRDLASRVYLKNINSVPLSVFIFERQTVIGHLASWLYYTHVINWHSLPFSRQPNRFVVFFMVHTNTTYHVRFSNWNIREMSGSRIHMSHLSPGFDGARSDSMWSPVLSPVYTQCNQVGFAD